MRAPAKKSIFLKANTAHHTRLSFCGWCDLRGVRCLLFVVARVRVRVRVRVSTGGEVKVKLKKLVTRNSSTLASTSALFTAAPEDEPPVLRRSSHGSPGGSSPGAVRVEGTKNRRVRDADARAHAGPDQRPRHEV